MTIPLGSSQRLRLNLQVQSLIFFYREFYILSTEKANSSFPLLNNLELIPLINTFLLHGLNPRPSLYNASAKNHLIVSQNLLFESLFSLSFRRHFWLSQIFDQRLLFDYKQLCIWLLEVSKHDEPGNHSKNQRLKPLGKGEFYLIISVSFTLVISFVHLFVLVLSIIVWLLSGGLNTCPKCGCVLLISLCIFLAGSE